MYKHFFKRVIDIILSLIGLVVFLLSFIVLAPIIYFSDKGPVFYTAKRIGRGGKLFKMYKYRTMIVDAPDLRLADGSTYNGEDDPRVTKIGKFMRKTSLDEIPQILNTLNGTMSFIGPRPDTPQSAHRYPEEEKYFLQVRPGITGYSQAYFRNSVDGKTKAVNDMYYAQHISFIFDVKIFFKTLSTTFHREGLYKNEEAVGEAEKTDE